jgi:hypothetical protein
LLNLKGAGLHQEPGPFLFVATPFSMNLDGQRRPPVPIRSPVSMAGDPSIAIQSLCLRLPELHFELRSMRNTILSESGNFESKIVRQAHTTTPPT